MDRKESPLATISQALAFVAALLAAGVAAWVGFVVLIVLEANDFPQCPELQPDKTLLLLLGIGSVAFAVASFVALFTRPPWAYALAAGQIPLVLAWYSVDGGVAGCLIG